MKILAIETSCDETAISLLEASGDIRNSKFKILKNLVASQTKIHRPFGGVVPTLAKREHLKNLPILFKKIQATKYKLQNTSLIAVTIGPGLEPCLWTGINFVPTLLHDYLGGGRDADRSVGAKDAIPVVGVNHIDGHLYSFLLKQKTPLEFPAVALVVSGGHTTLLLMKDLIHYKKLGETRDDAAGECFDKVARLLKLPYPGGPEIEKLAKRGDANAINFPRPMLNQKNYDFSFSGLKTSVLYYLRDNKNAKVEDVAASFQIAAFDVLIGKTLRAVKEFSAKSVILTGGVASNISLRKYLKLKVKNEKLQVNLFIPDKKFCTDNAAMIAVSGYLDFLQGKKRALKAQGGLSI